jgi:penicillin amidase
MRKYLLAGMIVFASAAARGQDDLLAKSKSVLATVDGELKASGLKEPVEVLRDKWGVPHIYAKNADDLFFAQGYVAAQDRLFQIDWWRRVNLGETAEVIGPDGVEGDAFARLIRYRGKMNSEWESYSPDARKIAVAFTSGINAWIKQSEKKLPIEFQLLGHTPKLWQPEDILGRMSGIVMSANFTNEVARAHLIDKLGLEKVRMLMPTDPVRDFAPAPELDLKGIDARILKGFHAASKAVPFKPSTSESNNWVVAATMSASGKPMLASDPHRAIAVPALRYLVHLNAPGWNVIGAGEPALPGVALGHNDHIAWGITIVGTDQADIFVEETNPDDPFQYKAGDKWLAMEKVVERIPVKQRNGTISDSLSEHYFTRHGPVIYRNAARRRAYALKWAGSEPGGAAYLGGLAVSRARNKGEFLKALEAYKLPSLNFVYADVEGNIGWVANALTPIRPKHDGLLPVPGNGGFDWAGYLKVQDLPQSFNPKTGWLATANHNIVPKGYPHQIGYEFAASYRFERVKANLEGKTKLTLDDFQRIQHDHVSIPGQLLSIFAKRLQFNNPEYHDRARMMGKWDGRMSRDSEESVICVHWLKELQKAVYARHCPPELVNEVASKSGLPTMFAALENPDERWFGKNPDSARDLLVQDAFVKAVSAVLKASPRGRDKLTWGALHTVTFRHPLAALNPQFEKTLNIGPFQRTGDGNTPNNTRYDDKFHQIHGATYRHLFDLADWDKGLATSAPGQSGQYGSPHYTDLAELWAKEQYFPLAYSRKKVEEVALHKLVLTP